MDMREGIVATTARPQRRRTNRKTGDRRVVRVETRDKMGHPRWITGDLTDSSEGGLGVSLRTPLEAGATIHIRANLGANQTNVTLSVRVTWCEERPDGTFQAGLKFQDEA